MMIRSIDIIRRGDSMESETFVLSILSVMFYGCCWWWCCCFVMVGVVWGGAVGLVVAVVVMWGGAVGCGGEWG